MGHPRGNLGHCLNCMIISLIAIIFSLEQDFTICTYVEYFLIFLSIDFNFNYDYLTVSIKEAIFDEIQVKCCRYNIFLFKVAFRYDYGGLCIVCRWTSLFSQVTPSRVTWDSII